MFVCLLHVGILFSLFTDYKLVIVCSSEDEDKSHMVSKLLPYKKLFSGILRPVGDFVKYLKDKFISWPEEAHKRSLGKTLVASMVDPEKYVLF